MKEKVISMYLGLAPRKDILRECGIGYSTYIRILRESGIKIRELGETRAIKQSKGRNCVDNSNASMYWLGVLATDGWVSKNKIGLGLKDKEHIEKFKCWSKSNNKIIERKQSKSECSYYEYKFSNKMLVKELASLGITERKTHTLNIESKELIVSSDFWRGCIDGDGWVYINKGSLEIGLCSASSTFINQYLSYVEKLLSERCRVIKTGNIYTLRLYGKRAEKLGREIYRDSSESTRLSRKYEVFING